MPETMSRKEQQGMATRLSLALTVMVAFFMSGSPVVNADYKDDTCLPGRTVIVHLFSWKWTDIADECERWLGPKGFCGVQISPPNEHIIINNAEHQRPWWERYQPISYKLESRSGNEAQFINMVQRCNAVGVRVYVDAVINHMCGAGVGSGTGSGGSSYNAGILSFPGVPYSNWDFNCCTCGMCTTNDCNIQNYQDVNQIRNCRLLGLLELALGKTYVRQKIADFMNNLINIGVGGFRVDAMKHMWPGDIQVLWPMLNNLNTAYFPANTRPFIFQEVIDLGGEAISASEYYHLGRVTEFKFSKELGRAFRGHYTLSNLMSCCESWGMMPNGQALVFVDNHDNQRGHGAGGAEVLTFWEPRQYKMATAFALAYDYGFARIMSSYYWPGGRWQGDWIGPPHDANYNVKDVIINSDQTCGNGWICEHRWQQINGMVQFRNRVTGQPATNKWHNNGNQIAFSRGNQGFLAINGDSGQDMNVQLQTGLSGGVYCDVISGILSNGVCTGRQIYVNVGGTAQITITANDEDPIIAIHAGAKQNGECATLTPPQGYQRTVVLIYIQTVSGQDAFMAGGIDHGHRSGCTSNAETSPCALSIANKCLGSGTHYEKHNAWRVGNTKLSWYGPQANQGLYYGVPAQGVPMVWTTNDQSHPGYQPVNNLGQHYWLADMYMNCAETHNGWFEFKAFLSGTQSGSGWESNINQVSNCGGSVGGSKPYSSGNHMGRCGYVNIFSHGQGSCTINNC